MTPKDAERLDSAIPVLEVSAFVDSTTVILTGYKVDQIDEGDELFVLGIGNVVIPNSDVPLVLPKRTLDVTVAAGQYLLAKGKHIRKTVSNGLAALQSAMAPKTVEARPLLSQDEASFLGNPGKAPIKTGDLVIRRGDLPRFLELLKAARESIKE